MDGLTSIFQNPNMGKALDTGSLGIGALSQWLAQRRYQGGIYGPYTDALKRAAALNPAAVSAGIQQLQQPMSQNLTNNVSNTVQAQMASRGLAQAPGIFSSTMAQALAPYEIKNREDAMAAYYKMLGLPAEFNPAIGLATGKPPALDLSGIISKIRNTWGGQGAAGGGPSISNYDPTGAYSPGFSQNPSDSYT